MERNNRVSNLLCALIALGLGTAAFSAAPAGRQPVYVYLLAKITDQVNMDISEDRLRHILPMVERYRSEHPEAHVSASVLFSGAISQALQERNSQTHILDFVKDYLHRGVIEVGYDGADEPTYDHRPTLNILTEPSPAGRWKKRQVVADEFLRQARDPVSGAPAGGDGGLKKMQEVFGKAAYIQGLQLAAEAYRPPQKAPPVGTPGAPPAVPVAATFGVFKEFGGDTETVQMLRPYNSEAIMFGVSAVNPAQLPSYREAITHFGRTMAPEARTAPELFWEDSFLRISEAAPPVHAVKAYEGVDALKAVLDATDRSTAHVLEIELGGWGAYLQPTFDKTAPNAPLKYAYDHPSSPKLPPDARRPDAEVKASWSKEDELLKWLAENEFRTNAGDRFLSNAELSRMAGKPNEFTVSINSLRTETAQALKDIAPDTHLFNYVRVDGHYLSLAELFQAMTSALAQYHRTHQMPQSVKVVNVYGPFRVVTGHGPNDGEISAGDLEELCDKLDGPLHADGPGPDGVPKNSVPPLVTIKDLNLNPAQLIKLMSMALATPAPQTKLPVRMAYVVAESGSLIPKTRPAFDVGFVWTLKPVSLSTGN